MAQANSWDICPSEFWEVLQSCALSIRAGQLPMHLWEQINGTIHPSETSLSEVCSLHEHFSDSAHLLSTDISETRLCMHLGRLPAKTV